MEPFILDFQLQEYATERQWEALKTWDKLKSRSKAAKELGISISTLQNHKDRVFKKAAQHGYAPKYGLTHKLPSGLSLRGASLLYNNNGEVIKYWNKSKQEGRSPEEVIQLPDPKTIVKLSTLYDQEGNVTQQWIAEKPEAKAQVEAWKLFAKELVTDVPRASPIPIPEINNDDLLVCYPIGDHHFGMLAWKEETGESYDLNIAEELLITASDYLIKKSSDCKYALIALMGDLFHYDDFNVVTPTNKNKLDSDTRYPKMVRYVLKTIRYIIERAAEIHSKVHVIVEIGNHDLSSSIFFMEALKNIYEDEKRITIDTSPMHFHYYKFGQNLIGTHHGHGKSAKLQDLPLIMATDRPGDWGQTKYHYWFTGHVHHDQVKDFPGCRVESLRVLAAPDAYAAQNGWRSKRDMKAIVFDKEYGEIARHIINPEHLYTILNN